MKRDTNHVVLEGSTFVCKHCGGRYVMNLPCPISVVVAATQAYVKDHANCKAPPPTTTEPL